MQALKEKCVERFGVQFCFKKLVRRVRGKKYKEAREEVRKSIEETVERGWEEALGNAIKMIPEWADGIIIYRETIRPAKKGKYGWYSKWSWKKLGYTNSERTLLITKEGKVYDAVVDERGDYMNISTFKELSVLFKQLLIEDLSSSL